MPTPLNTNNADSTTNFKKSDYSSPYIQGFSRFIEVAIAIRMNRERDHWSKIVQKKFHYPLSRFTQRWSSQRFTHVNVFSTSGTTNQRNVSHDIELPCLPSTGVTYRCACQKYKNRMAIFHHNFTPHHSGFPYKQWAPIPHFHSPIDEGSERSCGFKHHSHHSRSLTAH